MDLQPNNPETWFAGFCALLMALLGISTRRNLGIFEQYQADHEKRLRMLESSMATKGDISAIYERVNALSDMSTVQHRDLMNAILMRKGPQ